MRPSSTTKLAVNEGLSLQSITNMVMHARKLTAFFSKSVPASNAVGEVQVKLGKDKKGTKVDVCMRWNSTYFMIERLKLIKSDLYTVLNQQEFIKHKHLLLKENHWIVIDQILPTLKVLVETTEVLCVDKYATSSAVYPMIFGLMKNHLAKNELESALVRELKTKICDGIRKRMLCDTDSTEFYNSVCMVSSVFDPRYKRLKFLPEMQKNVVYSNVKKLLSILDAKSAPGPSDSAQNSDTAFSSMNIKSEPDTNIPKFKVSKLEKHNNALQFLMGDIIEIDDDTLEYCEFDQYMSEPVKSVSLNPFMWWKDNQSRFPKLSSLAKRYISIPATSVPSERAFSAAGLTITKQRSSLDPSVADAIIFLNKYNKRNQVSKRSHSNPLTCELTTDLIPQSKVPKPELPALPSFPADESDK